jgi:hypothetical protein
MTETSWEVRTSYIFSTFTGIVLMEPVTNGSHSIPLKYNMSNAPSPFADHITRRAV